MKQVGYIISQIIIFVSGLLSAFLTQVPNVELNKYACIIALIGTPFWIQGTYIAKQWGMFVVCVFFGGIWIYGVYVNWLI